MAPSSCTTSPILIHSPRWRCGWKSFGRCWETTSAWRLSETRPTCWRAARRRRWATTSSSRGRTTPSRATRRITAPRQRPTSELMIYSLIWPSVSVEWWWSATTSVTSITNLFCYFVAQKWFHSTMLNRQTQDHRRLAPRRGNKKPSSLYWCV